MSHTRNQRGSRSHLRQENRLKHKLGRWAVQTMVLIMVIIATSHLSQPDSIAVDGEVSTVVASADELDGPNSTTSTSWVTVVDKPSVEVDETPTSTTETTSTTSTTLPSPVLINVGSLNYPTDPVLVTMSFKATSEPYDDGLVNTISCNGQAELHVAIPANWQRVEIIPGTDPTYRVWTDNATYSAAGYSLSPTCVGTLPNEGIEEIPNAGNLFGLHDDDGKRTAAANQLLADLALASTCVNEAEINLHQATSQLLKEAFLDANPFVEESQVEVEVNQPQTRSLGDVTIFPGEYSLEFIVEPRCDRN